MKSFVQSMYLLTSAFGSALSEAFVPLVGDPQMMWLFTGIGCSAVVAGVLVYIIFRKYNATEEQMNDMGI
jgi:proton-dependent oligopeptide transporter, POT family